MKIIIDYEKQAIVSIENAELYEGDINSNSFVVLFKNVDEGFIQDESTIDFYPTLTQLAPNGREAGAFLPDALEEGETIVYNEDDVSYLKYSFTMNNNYVLMKGRSNFFIYVNKEVNGGLAKKVYGKYTCVLNESDNEYFVDDPAYNPKVKEYIDSYVEEKDTEIDGFMDDVTDNFNELSEQLEGTLETAIENQNTVIENLNGLEPSGVDTSTNILAKTAADGIWIGSDTGHWYYWNGTQYADGGQYLSNSSVLYGGITISGSNYPNLNNAPNNTILTYVPNSTDYSNYPTLTRGNLITLNGFSASAKNGTSQIYIDDNGLIYSRTTWDGTTWSNWNACKINALEPRFDVSGSNYKDFNTAPNNTILIYVPDNTYSNYPTLTKGNLITVNAYDSALKNGTSQLYIDNDGKIYTRTTWDGSTWSVWANPKIYALEPLFIDSALYPNLNDAPNNSIITYAPNSTTFSNYPTLERGTLITFNGYSPTSKAGTSQLYITESGLSYMRTTWNGSAWSSWKQTNVDNIHKYDDYVLDDYNFSGKSAVFFGDSITAGFIGIENNQLIYIDNPYPKLFSEYVGMTYYNEAVVNASFAPSSVTNLVGTQIENSTHKDVDYVFIACGVNDWNAENTIADMKTYINNNIDYIFANYPNAHIIFITPINNNRDVTGKLAPLQEYSNAITECAIMKDTNNKISVVQGYKFDFPTVDEDETFRNALFSDIVHPNQKGHSTAYLRGLIKALCK